jgi:hypothetical protein
MTVTYVLHQWLLQILLSNHPRHGTMNLLPIKVWIYFPEVELWSRGTYTITFCFFRIGLQQLECNGMNESDGTKVADGRPGLKLRLRLMFCVYVWIYHVVCIDPSLPVPYGLSTGGICLQQFWVFCRRIVLLQLCVNHLSAMPIFFLVVVV